MAIKVISDINSCDFKARSIVREVSILRQLKAMGGSKHVVEMQDFKLFMDEDSKMSIAIILERLPLDLKAVLDKAHSIDIDENSFKKIIYSFLCSLHYLESANIMHRDIKPANILLTKNGTAKLCDFGFARTVPTHSDYRGDKATIAKKLENDIRIRKNRKRNLSPHVITRAYRPPEVILLEK